MSKRRLVFYNDSRHFHLYCYDPPMRLQDAWAPVDEVAGTGVDTLVYGFGAGPTMFHNTEVGEIWGTRLVEAGNAFSQAEPSNLWALSSWRAYENLRSLREQGLDILTLLVERAHAKGLEFFGSLRMSHTADPKDTDTAHTWQFRIDHPEWCLKGHGKHAFNWVHPEVGAERLALIEEAVNRYDVDGFEVDWVFCPCFFEDGEAGQNAHVLTEFMREVRRVVVKAAQRRGRPIALGVRVLPTLSGNLAEGLDVPAWVKEGLLDFVAPVLYGPRRMDVDFPFEWLVDLTQPTACEVYPALQDQVRSVTTSGLWQQNRHIKDHPATLEHYRAGAAAYWSKGTDAIYLPWFNWPVGAEERQVLCEIHDPDLLTEKPKHYWTRIHEEETAAHGYAAQLPVTLTTGLDAPGQTVRLFVADDPQRAEARLRLQLTGSVGHDVMTISLNGTALRSETCKRTNHGGGGNIYACLEYPLPRGALRKGANEVAVAVHSRPRNLTAQVVLESVELLVTYPGPRANLPSDRHSMANRG